jgi:hypothetical protein
MLASPPCIVPGLVRGLIEAAAQENLQASQRGMEICRYGVKSIRADYTFEGNLRRRTPQSEDMKRFFKLFTESTFEGSQAWRDEEDCQTKEQAQPEMSVVSQLAFSSSSDSEDAFVAQQSTSRVAQFVDPNVMIGEKTNVTPLHVGRSGRSFRLLNP